MIEETENEPEDLTDGPAAAGPPVAEPRAPTPSSATSAKPKANAAKSSARKAAGKKRAGKKKSTGAKKSRGNRRGKIPFPASTFEDALTLPTAIQRLGSGQKIRRLTLFDELGRSPDSSASRELLYSSSRYGLSTGSHTAEWLELTPEGDKATNPDVPSREQARARFSLAIERFEPFKALYDRYVGNKLPTPAVMRHHLVEAVGLKPDDAAEAAETFIVNSKFVGVLKPVAGVERLLPLDHALDELPASSAEKTITSSPLEPRRPPSGRPAVEGADWSRTCFYVTPIGDEESEERRHADVFLASMVEPAVEALDRDFIVVRADHIDSPGIITAQVIEHVLRSALVIADLSFHNPNVFYELALRHASGKPTVLISRATDPLPFDVSDARTVLLDTADIWSFVPQMDTWRAEITRQARRALDDADGGANPLTTFFPSFRDHLR